MSKTWKDNDAKLTGSVYHKFEPGRDEVFRPVLPGGNGATVEYGNKNWKGLFNVERNSPVTKYSANLEHDSGLFGGASLTKYPFGDTLGTNVGYKLYQSPDKETFLSVGGFQNKHFGFDHKNDHGFFTQFRTTF